MPARSLRSTAIAALFSCFALAACTSVPGAAEPETDSGPLALCCNKVSEGLAGTNAELVAAVVRTPEQEAELNARIGGLRASKDACEVELGAADRDDAAAIARVKKAAGSFDLALNVPECK